MPVDNWLVMANIFAQKRILTMLERHPMAGRVAQLRGQALGTNTDFVLHRMPLRDIDKLAGDIRLLPGQVTQIAASHVFPDLQPHEFLGVQFACAGLGQYRLFVSDTPSAMMAMLRGHSEMAFKGLLNSACLYSDNGFMDHAAQQVARSGRYAFRLDDYTATEARPLHYLMQEGPRGLVLSEGSREHSGAVTVGLIDGTIRRYHLKYHAISLAYAEWIMFPGYTPMYLMPHVTAAGWFSFDLESTDGRQWLADGDELEPLPHRWEHGALQLLDPSRSVVIPVEPYLHEQLYAAHIGPRDKELFVAWRGRAHAHVLAIPPEETAPFSRVSCALPVGAVIRFGSEGEPHRFVLPPRRTVANAGLRVIQGEG